MQDYKDTLKTDWKINYYCGNIRQWNSSTELEWNKQGRWSYRRKPDIRNPSVTLLHLCSVQRRVKNCNLRFSQSADKLQHSDLWAINDDDGDGTGCRHGVDNAAGSRLPAGADIFLVATASRPGFRPTGCRELFHGVRGVKRPERVEDRSSRFIAGVKALSRTSSSPYVFMAQWLFGCIRNFYFWWIKYNYVWIIAQLRNSWIRVSEGLGAAWIPVTDKHCKSMLRNATKTVNTFKSSVS